MGAIEQKQQTGRAVSTTLPAVVAKGVALHMHNHPNSNIGEDYANYEGSTLIECLFSFAKVFACLVRFMSQVIPSLLPAPGLELSENVASSCGCGSIIRIYLFYRILWEDQMCLGGILWLK